MNSGRGSFHGFWSWLSSFPSFFGFIPSSRAICTCSCDRRNLRRASIQGCKFAGIRGCFFVISALYLRFAERDLWSVSDVLKSFRLHTRNLHHLGPLFGI